MQIETTILCGSSGNLIDAAGPGTGDGDIPFPVQCLKSTPKPTPSSLTTCSYVALNGSCTVTIDRLNPIVPPTIYAKRDAVITVNVINPSPFEDLTLDWKSTTAVLPPDIFSTIFSALTGNLGKITVLTQRGLVRGPAEISEDQKALLIEIQAPLFTSAPALQAIKAALQSPPLGPCSTTDPSVTRTWKDSGTWKSQVEADLDKAIAQAKEPIDPLKNRTDALTTEIAQLKASPDELGILYMNQVVLQNALSQRQNLVDRFTALVQAVDQVPSTGSGPKPPASSGQQPPPYY